MSLLLEPRDLSRAIAGLPGVHATGDGSLVIVLRAPNFAAAARLIAAVVEEAERAQHHPDIDLRWRTVIFTLSTHSAGGVTRLDVELAERILEAGRDLGAEPRPAPERLEIALDCVDAAAVRPFWAAALGYVEGPDQDGGPDLRDPLGRGPLLWFQRMDPPRSGRNRIHLDVFVADPKTVRRRVDAAVAAGGRVVNDEHAPSFWVMADPEGNELCVCTSTSAATTPPPTPPER